MNYVFKDNQLIWSGMGVMAMPPHSYLYRTDSKEWWGKYDRAYLRPVKPKHVPKELKALCLLLDIK